MGGAGDIRPAALEHLQRLFGPQAGHPSALFLQDWSEERWTSPPQVDLLANYSHFGHPLYQRPALEGRLHWVATETAAEFAGHVEGALAAGERASQAVLTDFSSGPGPSPTSRPEPALVPPPTQASGKRR